MDSTNTYVRNTLVKLLTIMTESGQSGFESIMNALDHQKVRCLGLRRWLEWTYVRGGTNEREKREMSAGFNNAIGALDHWA